jgi:hypothetical protein
MFTAISRWFRQKKLEREISNAVRDFQSRTVHTRLDPKIIQEIPDSEIELAIFDCAVSAMNADLSNESEILPTLNIGMRSLYATWLVEAEVNNGGFNQYFWNSSGRSVHLAIQGFRYFDAEDLAKLTEQALAIWESEESIRKPLIEANTIEAFSESYNQTQLSSLDTPFLDASADFSSKRISKIRQAPEQFSTHHGVRSLGT